MKKVLLFAFIELISISFSFGQGIIRGNIKDENGESIIGASVVLKSNPSYGVTTDIDGNYSLKINDSTAQVIIISFISYKSIEESVHPVNGPVLIKNYFLKPASQNIKEVEVTAKAVKAKEYYTELIKKNSAATLDYISSETMKKTGDVNVVAAIARVTGVSTNGGFITVRGIGDRYIKTGINGSRIPTLDPFTNNIKLDLFPSSLVDNILITKTANPDIQGDWAGAFLSVETKDYPDQLSVNVETSIGYNNQTTFKNTISSQRSSTDWLGFDNGLRNRSHNPNDFVPPVLSPTQYQQFVTLGLGPYYNSIGVTQSNWLLDGSNGDVYFKLGLVQMGLLSPALINVSAAFANAKELYSKGNFNSRVFQILNAGAVKTGQSFPDNWNTVKRKAPLDFTQNFSIGNQVNLFGKPLGFLFGFRYGSSMLNDPNSIAQRPYAVTGLIQSSKNQDVSKEINGWSALFNLAYKFNPNNSISFLFMPNITGINNARSAYDNINNNTTLTQFYEERKQLIYQLKSEHYLEQSKIKIETNFSYTKGNSTAPDFKVLDYKQLAADNTIVIDPTNDRDDRIYRYLSDNIFDSRISAELPIENKNGRLRKLKFGGAYQQENLKKDQNIYHLNYGNNLALPPSNNLDQILSLENFAISDNSIAWCYSKDDSPIDHTYGRSSVTAVFAMLDYTIIPSLRVTGGLRIEQANIFTDVNLYDSLGYASNDSRRNYKAGYPSATPGKLDALSYLPSVNLIYKLKKDELAPVNLRLNYSETVARPSIREISVATEFDYELQANVTGNSNLKLVRIKNYDVRLESYFKNGDNVSVSLFYKNFKNPIELIYSDSYYWQNTDKSRLSGIELEGKKAITKHFEFRANLTLTNSLTTFIRTRQETIGGITTTYNEDTVSRPNFGQAPYIINGILAYTLDNLGLNATLSYNVQGSRLVIGSNNPFLPDIYEQPRHLLDFKVIKKISKHFSASLTARNILNTSIKRIYNGWNTDYDKYKYGTTYVFGITYNL